MNAKVPECKGRYGHEAATMNAERMNEAACCGTGRLHSCVGYARWKRHAHRQRCGFYELGQPDRKRCPAPSPLALKNTAWAGPLGGARHSSTTASNLGSLILGSLRALVFRPPRDRQVALHFFSSTHALWSSCWGRSCEGDRQPVVACRCRWPSAAPSGLALKLMLPLFWC